MSIPTIPRDMVLYNKIKKKLFIEMPNNSAYRSGQLVRKYKAAYEKKYKDGSNPYSNPYIGAKKYNKGLDRWYKEKWVNQLGEIGYQKKGDIYRPTIKITNKTPKTYDELNNAKIKTAIKLKKSHGRVNRF
jgi:hypothetical protein